MHKQTEVFTLASIGLAILGFMSAGAAQEAIYRCGNEYTNNAGDAVARGCKKIEGANVTVIQAPKSIPGASPTASSATRPPGAGRIDSSEQRSRDLDSRSILESELMKAETKLSGLQKEYNAGEPERRGDERNYQKYLDRLETLKREVTRAQADVDSLKRELQRLPSSAQR